MGFYEKLFFTYVHEHSICFVPEQYLVASGIALLLIKSPKVVYQVKTAQAVVSVHNK